MIKEPKIFLNRLLVIYGIICLLLAAYMTVILIGRYQVNSSATSIAYRKYAERDEDKYPTFSLCFRGDGLYQYDGSAVFKAYGINSANYERILDGKPAFRFDYDLTSKLYSKSAVPQGTKSNLTFGYMVKNYYEMLNIIKNQSVTYEGNVDSSKGPLVEKSQFYISYQTPKMRCFTRQWRDTSKLIRTKESLYLDLSLLEFNAVVRLFIHYPGQLMRYLDSPSFSSKSDVIQEKGLEIKISQGTILRKRSVTDMPCQNNIEKDDFDLHAQKALSHQLGCVPPFWMNRVNGTLNRQECTLPKELKEVNGIIGNSQNMLAGIQTPCIDMFNSVVWNWLSEWKKRGRFAFFEIFYVDKYYEEITQVEDFGPQDFISNLGGFIGIFLGYSMMQIPELLGNSINPQLSIC